MVSNLQLFFILFKICYQRCGSEYSIRLYYRSLALPLARLLAAGHPLVTFSLNSDFRCYRILSRLFRFALEFNRFLNSGSVTTSSLSLNKSSGRCISHFSITRNCFSCNISLHYTDQLDNKIRMTQKHDDFSYRNHLNGFSGSFAKGS